MVRPLYFVGQVDECGDIQNLTKDFNSPKCALREARLIKGINPEIFVDEKMALYMVKGNLTNKNAQEIDWRTYYS